MIWLLLSAAIVAVGLLGGSLLLRRWPKCGKVILWFTALVAAVLISGTAICWDMPEQDIGDADYALLLGCALENGEATPELIRRCETALTWLQSHPEGMLVASGGDPAGQGITEAAVMVQWLIEHGANPDQVVPEDQARDTRENLLLSKKLIHGLERETDTVLIITSEYHQTRAHFLARQNGQTAVGLSCATPFGKHLIAAVREVYSFAKAIAETM